MTETGAGLPASRGASGSGRSVTILGAIMIGWMFLTMALAVFGGGGGDETVAPVTIGRGVTVAPASGWSSAEDEWPVGPNETALKRAGVIVVFAADAYGNDAQALLDEQLTDIEGEFASLRTLPAASMTIAGDLPALRVLFSGVSGSARLDGQVVTAARGGTGVVMLALAPSGQLRRVQDDLDEMLATLVVP